MKRKDVFLGAFALGCKICYSLDDSGYYYERDKEDSWIQMGTTSLEIKRCLLLGRKAGTNLHSILENMYITLLTKVDIVQAMVSPVDLSGCER